MKEKSHLRSAMLLGWFSSWGCSYKDCGRFASQFWVFHPSLYLLVVNLSLAPEGAFF